MTPRAVALLACLVTVPTLAAAEPALLSGRLVLGEVLYDPVGPEAGAEAFEIWNAGREDVDLAGWSATDRDVCRPDPSGPLVAYALPLSGVVPALGRLVVTVPSVGGVPKCLSLANGGDDLVLLAPDGAEADALAWGAGGREGWSLQRCEATDAWARAAPTLGGANVASCATG